jgi:hypothetical protein
LTFEDASCTRRPNARLLEKLLRRGHGLFLGTIDKRRLDIDSHFELLLTELMQNHFSEVYIEFVKRKANVFSKKRKSKAVTYDRPGPTQDVADLDIESVSVGAFELIEK